jgi:hypothetical protein
MSTQNQGNSNSVLKSLAYDNPSYLTRQSTQLATSAAGSGGLSAKFVAHAALVVFGVTFSTVAAGTSTFTVNGTATNPGTTISALYVTNTSTATVGLATNTVGPFGLGGTSTTGTNVNVGGLGGGVVGGFNGPYALNTLGGTNTSQVWGTQTFLVGPPGGANAGYGGLPMNPGDTLQFVNGTDATATWIPVIQWALAAPNSQVIA